MRLSSAPPAEPPEAFPEKLRRRRWSLRAVVFLATGLLLATVAVVFVVLALQIRSLRSAERQAERSEQVMQLLAASQRRTVDLETGVRGYLLTGRREYLAPYLKARSSLPGLLAQLASLTRPEPAKAAQIAALGRGIESYERAYAAPLAAGSGIFSQGRDTAVTAQGKRLLDALRARFEKLEAAELRDAGARRALSSDRAGEALALGAGGCLLVLALVLAVVAYLFRSVLDPIRRAAEAARVRGGGQRHRRLPEGGLGEVRDLAQEFNSMAATLERRGAELRRATTRFQQILDNSSALMFVKDAEGRYLLVNRAFERTRGLQASEVIGRSERELTPGAAGEEIAQRDAEVLAAGQPISFEQNFELEDGMHTFLSVKFPLLGDTGEDAIGGIGTDITAQRRAYMEAIEASRAKSEFVANMSHELRTPLNGVVGMTDLLRATELDAVQREYTDALSASADALLSVINDVLDFSKIEAGHLELDPTDFELRAAVEEACLMVAEQAHGKGLELSHWVASEVPEFVRGDRGRLRQVLLNLLSNAVKFTSEGEVVLRLRAGGGGTLRFEVLDTGIGVDPARVAELFEPFVQGDQSTTRRFGGTGLGLAISSELVRKMGGAIAAAPRPEGGSVFSFDIRLPAIEGGAPGLAEGPPLDGVRALIVDDNATNRMILEHYLGAWGIACVGAEAVAPALAELDRATAEGAPFQVALVDYNLPGADGLELVRGLAARPAQERPAAIVLSSSPLDRGVAEAAGAKAVLTKPTPQGLLRETIGLALDRRRAAGPGESKPREQAPAPGRLAPAGTRVLLAEDNEVNVTVACALLARLGLEVDVANDGLEAVAMALQGDYAAVLMDCQMPRLDGYEATEVIRMRQRDGRIPIIAMTAHSLPEDREHCLASGMDDYLCKPVREHELAAVLNRWLQGGEGEVEQPPAVEEGNGPLDERIVEELRLSLPAEVRAQLLETFERSLEQVLGELTEALDGADHERLRAAAHRLKGGAASLGAERLRRACERIERSSRAGDPGIGAEDLAWLRSVGEEAVSATREAFAERAAG